MRPHALLLLLLTVGSALAEATGTIAFASSATSVTEGGPAIVTIVRSGDLSGSATANWTLSDGTARVSQDYEPGGGSITFLSGMASATATVTTRQNTAIDGSRSFFINLSTPDATLGSPSSTTVVIIDDDSAGGTTGGGTTGGTTTSSGHRGCGHGAAVPAAAGLLALLALRGTRRR